VYNLTVPNIDETLRTALAQLNRAMAQADLSFSGTHLTLILLEGFEQHDPRRRYRLA